MQNQKILLELNEVDINDSKLNNISSEDFTISYTEENEPVKNETTSNNKNEISYDKFFKIIDDEDGVYSKLKKLKKTLFL